MNKKEKKYLEAKSAYYNGNPFMTDHEFDQLEEELRDEGSDVVDVVGTPEIEGDKITHPSSMKSLAKIQVNDETDMPKEDVVSFLSKSTEEVEATLKFDGSAVNLIYQNGHLMHASTRGDGEEGIDITDKIKYIVSLELKTQYQDLYDTIEIRGEVVIPKSKFEEQYSDDFKNPRNFVAGILGRDDVADEIVRDFEFFGFDIRLYTNDNDDFSYSTNTITDLCQRFNSLERRSIKSYKDFEKVYKEFREYRYEGEFGVDGIVLKHEPKFRDKIGERTHSPKWAVAIKFPAEKAVTEVIDVEWDIGYTGELTPTANLKPVDLDGTTVSRAALHNLGYIKENEYFPGAKVEIIKSGDIIPKIIRLVENSPRAEYYNNTLDFPGDLGPLPKFDDSNVNHYYDENHFMPTAGECPSCNDTLYIDDVHLYCYNEQCERRQIRRFEASVRNLDVDFIGPAMAERLYEAGVKNTIDLLDPDVTNKDTLTKFGDFKDGRLLERMLDELNSINEMKLSDLVNVLKFHKVGSTIAKKIAKNHAGLDVDWKGIDHEIREKAKRGDYTKKINEAVKACVKRGIEIEKPKPDNEVVKFEMTGSPKDFGYKKKSEFVDEVTELGAEKTTISNADVLVTNSMSSSSGKMKKADKKGIKIMTYDEFVEYLK